MSQFEYQQVPLLGYKESSLLNLVHLITPIQLKPLNSVQIIQIQLTLMNKVQMSSLLNSVQIIILIQLPPLLKVQTSSLTHPVLNHNQDRIKHLKPIVKFPPVDP